MNFDDIAAELPPSHDDELASLRQDIVDELADHLHCALQRELLTSGKRQPSYVDIESHAWKNVLNRFGNPATLARRLWLEAMQETIMAQRATLVMASITAAAALLACVLLWRFVSDSRNAQIELLQAQRQSSAVLVDKLTAALAARPAPLADDQLLNRLTAAIAAGQNTDDPTNDWIAMQVNLVDEAGQPVQGRVVLNSKTLESGEQMGESGRSNNAGIVQIDSLPPGEYSLKVFVDKPPVELEDARVVVGPGRPTEITVACPTEYPPPLEMKFDLTLPADLVDRELYLHAFLRYKPREFAGRKWEPQDSSPFSVLLNARGEVLGAFEDYERSDLWLRGSGQSQIHVIDVSLNEVPTLYSYPLEISLTPYVPLLVSPPEEEGVPRFLEIAEDYTDRMRFELTPDEQHQATVSIPVTSPWWVKVRDDIKYANRLHTANVELVLTEPDGAPAIGYEIDFPRGRSGPKFGGLDSAATGAATVYSEKPGAHSFEIESPHGEKATVTIDFDKNSPHRIVCPTPEPAPAAKPITLTVDEPDWAKDLDLRYAVTLTPKGRQIDGVLWEAEEEKQVQSLYGQRFHVILDADGSDVRTLGSVIRKDVARLPLAVLAVHGGDALDAQLRDIVYSATIGYVYWPLSEDLQQKLQLTDDAAEWFTGARLNWDMANGPFDVRPSADTSVDVTLSMKDAIWETTHERYAAWLEPLTKKVVTVPAEVEPELVGQRGLPQTRELIVTIPQVENNIVSRRKLHLTFAKLVKITVPPEDAKVLPQKAGTGRLMPVVLLVDNDDLDDVQLAVKHATLRIGLPPDLTDPAATEKMSREELRKLLLSLPENEPASGE